MTAADLAALLDAKPSGGSWMAKCPAHDDRNPSLAITQAEDKVLLHCNAGCTWRQIIDAMGLHPRDIFNGDGTVNKERSMWAKIKSKHDKEQKVERFWERAGYND